MAPSVPNNFREQSFFVPSKTTETFETIHPVYKINWKFYSMEQRRKCLDKRDCFNFSENLFRELLMSNQSNLWDHNGS